LYREKKFFSCLEKKYSLPREKIFPAQGTKKEMKRKTSFPFAFRSLFRTFAADNQKINKKMDDYPADNYNS